MQPICHKVIIFVINRLKYIFMKKIFLLYFILNSLFLTSQNKQKFYIQFDSLNKETYKYSSVKRYKSKHELFMIFNKDFLFFTEKKGGFLFYHRKTEIPFNDIEKKYWNPISYNTRQFDFEKNNVLDEYFFENNDEELIFEFFDGSSGARYDFYIIQFDALKGIYTMKEVAFGNASPFLDLEDGKSAHPKQNYKLEYCNGKLLKVLD